MSYPTFDAQVEAALKFCSLEPVDKPGAIQAHRALIAVDTGNLEICYASDNTRNFLRVGADKLLGRRLNEVFGPQALHHLNNGMMRCRSGIDSADLGAVQFAGQPLDVTASRAGGHTLFEFEMDRSPQIVGPETLKDFVHLFTQAHGAETREELFERTVHMLHMLTGFDHVMIYEFDGQGNGKVEAEHSSLGTPSYLGLSFPSWDIPEQARSLMMKLPLRCICDIDVRPAQVIAAQTGLPELDLTHGILRATSRVHLEYLRNMGTLGSMTLNIVIDNHLWGIIALHHRSARFPNQRIRRMCRSFAEFFT